MFEGNFGSFVALSEIYALSEKIEKSKLTSEELRDLLADMNRIYINMANVINSKETALYYTDSVKRPVNCSNTWFPVDQRGQFRDALRVVVNFGALPNTATKTVAHNIPFVNRNYIVTRLTATASDNTNYNYISIPYAGVGNSIELSLDQNNVIITTTTNRTSFTICYVVIEYIPF